MALTASPNAPSIVLIIHVGQHVKGFRDTSQGREGGNSTRLNIVFCVRRVRRHSLAGANPARQLSLQPVAVGADDGGNDIV